MTEGIAAARDFGYDCVELHVRAPEELELVRLQTALDESGMAVGALGTGRVYVDDGLSLIDRNAGRGAAPFVRVHRRGGDPARKGDHRLHARQRARADRLQECLGLLGEAMRRADAYANERGVTLLLEAINRYENNYLCSVYDAAAFIRNTGLLSTGILADTFHMNIEERDLATAIRENVGLIRYVHAADSNRQYPGAGHTDFVSIFAALKAGGFDGEISAECLPVPNDETAAVLWLENMKGYLAAL